MDFLRLNVVSLKKFHFKGKTSQFMIFLKIRFTYILSYFIVKILFIFFIKFRKDYVVQEKTIVLDLENTWFMDFKYIPLQDQSKFNEIYNKEIFRMFSSSKKNAKKLLETSLSKILKEDFHKIIESVMINTLCIQVKDSFEAKIFSFQLMIDNCDGEKLEFKVRIKDSEIKELFDSMLKLQKYLKRDVLYQLFSDLLI